MPRCAVSSWPSPRSRHCLPSSHRPRSRPTCPSLILATSSKTRSSGMAKSMTESQVQAFLNARVSSCAAGYTCLKTYRETTRTIEATPMCGRYEGAANESAAQIITKVARSCGVSPKVILVMLQKEQGLVTASAPSSYAYRSAMGAGCPDTAACDSDYYGFFNQVHYGAYLLKRYTQPAGTGSGTLYPTRFDRSYPVGAVTAILYNPNRNCGTRAVLVQNQATHALYLYTPYTPNQNALNAGYAASSDPCSSYGNRNFYNYYNDWFGPSRGPAIGIYFREYAMANASWLGNPVAAMECGRPDSGCIQSFQGGIVAGSYSTVAAGVRTNFAQHWGWYGRELGTLRYPITEYRCDNMLNGCRQEFQGGWIVTFGGATPIVAQPVRELWSGSGSRVRAPRSRYVRAPMCRYGVRSVPPAVPGRLDRRSTQRQSDDGPNCSRHGLEQLGQGVGSARSAHRRTVSQSRGGTYSQVFSGGAVNVVNGVGTIAAASRSLARSFAEFTMAWNRDRREVLRTSATAGATNHIRTAGSWAAPPVLSRCRAPFVCSGAGTAASSGCWASPQAHRPRVRPPATTPRPSNTARSPSPTARPH